VGLRNLGNTCYLNSILQCMTHLEPLRDFVLSGQYEAEINRKNPLGKGGQLVEAFADLVRAMWCVAGRRPPAGLGLTPSRSDSCADVAPTDLRRVLGTVNSAFASYAQQDSSEALLFLSDGLHEDLNRIKERPLTNFADANGAFRRRCGQQRQLTTELPRAWRNHARPARRGGGQRDVEYAAAARRLEDHRLAARPHALAPHLPAMQPRNRACFSCLAPPARCPQRLHRLTPPAPQVKFDPYSQLQVPIPTLATSTVHVLFVPISRNGAMCVRLAAKLPRRAMAKDLAQRVAEAVDVQPEDLVIYEVFDNKTYKPYFVHSVHDEPLRDIKDNDVVVRGRPTSSPS
jgi:hypothetical protein